MTDSPRERILGRVRAATHSLPEPAEMPVYDPARFILPVAAQADDLWELFTERVGRVNGRAFSDCRALAEFLIAEGHTEGFCDAELIPLFAEYFAGRGTLFTSFDRTDIDRYAFGITRAVGVIAESGSVILSDARTPRLPALTPWVHVAVVPSSAIHRDIPGALAALGDDPNIVWCSGPSKTADVEGILIEGVHGPGAQFVLRTDD